VVSFDFVVLTVDLVVYSSSNLVIVSCCVCAVLEWFPERRFFFRVSEIKVMHALLDSVVEPDRSRHPYELRPRERCSVCATLSHSAHKAMQFTSRLF
jgi:hypothetical protein